jgi:hypothetical protein
MDKTTAYKNFEKNAAISIRNSSLNYLEHDFDTKQENTKGLYYDLRIFTDPVTNIHYYPYMFSKTLEHGIHTFPKKEDVDLLLHSSIEEFKLSSVTQRKLEGAKGHNSFNLIGADPSVTLMHNIPKVTDEPGVFEMAEVYSMSLHRHVPFIDYETSIDSVILQELNNFDNKNINHSNIFTGHSIQGPYVSQYLLLPYSIGSMKIDQKYTVELDSSNVITETGYLEMQNGVSGPPSNYQESNQLYVYNGQVLGSIVHKDPLYNFYYGAALISLQNNIPPEYTSYGVYSSSWTSGGPPDIFASVAAVAAGALKCAWFQKWAVAMRIRPEALASRVNSLMKDKNLANTVPGFDHLEEHLKKCPNILDKVKVANHNKSGEETYFLNTIYPEGSPTHPSTVAGHAAVAGACTTVLKAMLKTHNENGELVKWPKQHVIANSDGTELVNIDSDTTIVNELDKLAFNVARGRDFAGVHYCVDGKQGIEVGEKYAISYLRDKCLEYSEKFNNTFNGWTLTKFDGTTIKIL